jgi:hypothetical protein
MKRTLMMTMFLLSSSAVAWAGRVSHPETKVDLTHMKASGSLYGTRHSSDSVQLIGCMVAKSRDSQGDYLYAYCYAQDKDSEFLQCYTRDDALVDAVLDVTANSYISFRCEPESFWNGWTLTNFYVMNGSHLTGPMP